MTESQLKDLLNHLEAHAEWLDREVWPQEARSIHVRAAIARIRQTEAFEELLEICQRIDACEDLSPRTGPDLSDAIAKATQPQESHSC